MVSTEAQANAILRHPEKYGKLKVGAAKAFLSNLAKKRNPMWLKKQAKNHRRA